MKFIKKSKNNDPISDNPPDYNKELSNQRSSLSQDPENLDVDGTNEKNGKPPVYESEKDHQLRKLEENYGFGGGIGGPGFGCPKLPIMAPRQQKAKKDKASKE